MEKAKALVGRKIDMGGEKERFLYSPEPLNRWGDISEVRPSPGGEKREKKLWNGDSKAVGRQKRDIRKGREKERFL